jgi:hypothetical protein
MSYCVVADVEKLTSLTYGATTTPTTTEVSAIIAEISSEIDVVLTLFGYSLPITDATDLSFLKMLSSVGSAAASDRATFSAGNEGEHTNARTLQERYDRILTAIQSGVRRLLTPPASSRFFVRTSQGSSSGSDSAIFKKWGYM